jgi:hypothetical protein
MIKSLVRKSVLRPWLVVCGMADGPISESNPMVRVVHRDNLDRAIEVMRNQGYAAAIKVFSAKTNLAARDWADRIADQQELIGEGKNPAPLRRPVKRITRINVDRLLERVAPSEDPFGYYNDHYAARQTTVASN